VLSGPGTRMRAMDLPTRLRDLRVQAGLTKTALAKPKYTVSYVSQIEAGRRTPGPEAMAFFAQQLGVSPRYLSTGIPEDMEEQLQYQLEEAEAALKDSRAKEAERKLRNLASRLAEFDMKGLRQRALILIAEAMVEQGKMGQAIDAYEEALDQDLTDRQRGLAVVGIARAYRMMGDLRYAAELVETHLEKTKRAPLDPAVAAELQSVLVSIYFERGDVVRAERCARRALAAATNAGSLELRAKAYWYAGRVLAETKQWAEALEAATRARVLMEELQDRQSVAQLHNAYAFVCLETEPPRIEEAKEHLDMAEALLSASGGRGELAYVLEERGRLALMQDRPEEALAFAERAISESDPDQLEGARCGFLKGRALSALGRYEEARATLQEAAAIFSKRGARQQEASCWRELGEVDLAKGDVDSAVAALRAGLEALDPRRTRA
jgi:tetratricopeptide (TPR) repeat protein